MVKYGEEEITEALEHLDEVEDSINYIEMMIFTWAEKKRCVQVRGLPRCLQKDRIFAHAKSRQLKKSAGEIFILLP